ncbi:class I SAM-dependent methyltransferase [Saccharothrix lopnurensis]|uniref:Class I SAM-dependent methyltransferase n=1 Tax=Saccharothrix lopnurensis TaxID=1670621 RepID=A0ABW1PIP3_9PSEU
MSAPPSSTWYVDFFTELPNEFWRRAVPPEVTVEEIDFVEERLGLAPGSLVLDVPCGSGRHSLELARRGHRVTGVDLSAEAILPGYRFSRGDEQLDVTAIHHVYTVAQIIDLLSGNGFTDVGLFDGPGGEPYGVGSGRLLLTARRTS